MHVVVFGLTISSAWGNGHATPWRGLCRALSRRGHRVTFFERDVPYYAAHRDAPSPEGCDLRLYRDWDEVAATARRLIQSADVEIVTSYCPDAQCASDLLLDAASGLRVYYDLDAPVTLDRLERGERVDYVPRQGLAPFDLVLSFTGGAALDALRTQLGARAVEPLYGGVDPDAHRPVDAPAEECFDLTYLGTYAEDRQVALEALFIEPARQRPDCRFAIAGSQYPAAGFPWQPNIFYLSHMPPPDHPAFYCASRLTLNITRGAMARMGYCPSGRLFEAAACGTPIVSDWWVGLDTFFEPGAEILIARDTDDVLAAIAMSDEDRRRIGRAARERALAEHTAEARAKEFERYVGDYSGRGAGQPHAAAGVLEGAAAGGQPPGWRPRAAARGQ